MAGAGGPAMAIATCEVGGLGSLPCAMLDVAAARKQIGIVRQRTSRPLNTNFFCHRAPWPAPDGDTRWQARLAAYYVELGIAAALALGATGAQIGTAYLFTAESRISGLHRTALRSAADHRTALTNIFTGRPARGLVNRIMDESGPASDDAPAFPTAGLALAPLRSKAEAADVADFSPLWAGQAVGLGRELGSAELTRELAASAQRVLRSLVPGQ